MNLLAEKISMKCLSFSVRMTLPAWYIMRDFSMTAVIMIEIDPQYGIHKAVKRIKGYSSVGGAPLSVIKQYIEDQKNV